MKTKIEITGKMMLCEYASKELLLAEAKDDLDTGEKYDTAIECAWSSVDYTYFYLLSDIKVLANGEDITKKKGKYVKVDDLVRSELATESQPYPIEFRFIRPVDYFGEIELDVDDFDPKKLQMRKSTYEFEDIPYALDAMHIIYDGELKELNVDEMYDYYDRWGCGKRQAMWEGFLYEYKGKLYKIADIERTNDKQLLIELVEDNGEQEDIMADILFGCDHGYYIVK